MNLIFPLIIVLLLSGCAVQKTDVKTAGFEEPPAKPAPDYSSGSIWQSSSAGLTDDLKARRRGDTLTIVISEVASASKASKTDTSRGSEISAGIPNFMGLEGSKVASQYLADLSKLISASNASKFSGSGSTSRDESLKATITARVVDVLPNGNLLIEGRRNIKVNNEDQEIVLEGTVRPRDVAQDNTVNSIYVADAKISYSGRGIISDQQSPGWLMSILDKVWPF
ncbi:MAG: flagellar basal body L-ring protein FlgH [Desulfuromonadaceae bacterium]|nr:flagellar basal body L-ring protein FlgH [Desulfuromonadaceae bacterium]MDD2854021.1 flagellar basal body L-ring protein FlgH [Desulfuromonadaceae bacterium]